MKKTTFKPLSSIIETVEEILEKQHSIWETNSINVFNLEIDGYKATFKDFNGVKISKDGYIDLGMIAKFENFYFDEFSFSHVDEEKLDEDILKNVFNKYKRKGETFIKFLDGFFYDNIEDEEQREEYEEKLNDIKDEYQTEYALEESRDFGYYGFNNNVLNQFSEYNLNKDKLNGANIKTIIYFNFFLNNSFNAIKRNIVDFKQEASELNHDIKKNYYHYSIVDDLNDLIYSIHKFEIDNLDSVLKYNLINKIIKTIKLIDKESEYKEILNSYKKDVKIIKAYKKLDRELKTQPIKTELKKLKI